MSKARTGTAGRMIPLGILILIVIVQMISYFAIISFESASVYYDAGRGTIYAGYWCTLGFLIAWIAMLAFRRFSSERIIRDFALSISLL